MNHLGDEELEEFMIEASELLTSGEESLLALESGGDYHTQYDSIFRVFHSLKGAAGMLGLDEMQEHMHKLEDLLGKKKEDSQLSQNEITYFLSGIDAARKLLDGETVHFKYESIETLKTLNSGSPTPKASPPPQTQTKSPGCNKIELPMIYIIDDEPEILELSQSILGEEFSTRTFTNPKEAVQEIEKNDVDLVVTDIRMPEMSGMEVTKKVNSFQRDIPVILASGIIDKNLLLEALEDQVFLAIEKPFVPNNLIAACRNAIQRSQLVHLVDSSIDLIMTSFADVESLLKSQGKTSLQKKMRNQLEKLIRTRNIIRESKNHSKAS